MPSAQSRIIEQAKFTYSPLVKAFGKKKNNWRLIRKEAETLKGLESHENKQDIKSIHGIFPKETRTNDIKNEIDETKKWEEKIWKNI